MEDIKMVDLKAQYGKIKPELDAAFSAVMESMEFINGPQVGAFARSLESYLNVRHAIPCANGTDALQIALMALQLPAGSEVIVPSFNYVSAAEVVALLGLRPVFADVLPDTFNLDPASVKQVISANTKALIPVHLFGQSAPMQELMEISEEHQLWVIEDNAQSLGTRYVRDDEHEIMAGTLAHIGTTSFFPSKPLGGMGDGGAVFTNNDKLAETIRKIANHGQTEKYKFSTVGVNSRLDTLQAAMLDVKIKYLDEYNEAREEIARFYDNTFAELTQIKAPHRASYSSHVYHQYTIQVEPSLRDGLKEYLRDNHIPSMIYYPTPLHLQEAYAKLGYEQGSLPVSERLASSVLSLPMHSELKEDQLTYICEHVLTYIKNNA